MRVATLLLVLLVLLLAPPATIAVVDKVHRKNHLDYLNADTLQYFLQRPKLDYDAVVMFYANWDRNSHTFANLYAQMAQLLQAGTQESKLVLGLFDCEADPSHVKLCTAAGITHYPTTLYFSFASDGIRHYTYGGNWMYGDAVLDWIKTLRALSSWRRAGWGTRLRQWVLGRGSASAGGTKPALPVGIPSSVGPVGTAAAAGGGKFRESGQSSSSDEEAATAAAAVKALEQVRKLQDDAKISNDLLARSAAMMEAVLFPMTYPGPVSTRMRDAHKNYTDLFAYLNQTDGWTTLDAAAGAAAAASQQRQQQQYNPATEARHQVLRACLQDVALEYCQRFSAIATDEYLSEHPEALSNVSATTDDLIALIADHLQHQEPYCAIVETCVIHDFIPDQCRPSICPFADPAACRFITSCFYESMQQQYARALGITLPNGTAAAAATTTTTTTATSPSSTGGTAPPPDGANLSFSKEQQQDPPPPPKKKSAWGL